MSPKGEANRDVGPYNVSDLVASPKIVVRLQATFVHERAKWELWDIQKAPVKKGDLFELPLIVCLPRPLRELYHIMLLHNPKARIFPDCFSRIFRGEMHKIWSEDLIPIMNYGDAAISINISYM